MDSLLMFITLLLWPLLTSSQSLKTRRGGEKSVENEVENGYELTGYKSDDIIEEKDYEDSKEYEYASYEYLSVETVLNSIPAEEKKSHTKKFEPTKVINDIMSFTFTFFFQMMENFQKIKDEIEGQYGYDTLIPKQESKGHRLIPARTKRFRHTKVCRGFRGGLKGQHSCCSKENPCHYGEGDCDRDDHCRGNLTCGRNNCKRFERNEGALKGSDCCQKGGCHDSLGGFEGQESCCTKEKPCWVGGGGCNHDDHCEEDLICGENNCRDFLYNLDALKSANCCKAPGWNRQYLSEWMGDCDKDEDCDGDLICGTDNCGDLLLKSQNTRSIKFGKGPLRNDDCCVKPNCTMLEFQVGQCARPAPRSEGWSCFYNRHCKGDLVCKGGKCRDPRPASCKGREGQERCCTKKSPCRNGGGNCFYDDDCQGELKCGRNNCQKYNKDAKREFNCCWHPCAGLSMAEAIMGGLC